MDRRCQLAQLLGKAQVRRRIVHRVATQNQQVLDPAGVDRVRQFLDVLEAADVRPAQHIRLLGHLDRSADVPQRLVDRPAQGMDLRRLARPGHDQRSAAVAFQILEQRLDERALAVERTGPGHQLQPLRHRLHQRSDLRRSDRLTMIRHAARDRHGALGHVKPVHPAGLGGLSALRPVVSVTHLVRVIAQQVAVEADNHVRLVQPVLRADPPFKRQLRSAKLVVPVDRGVGVPLRPGERRQQPVLHPRQRRAGTGLTEHRKRLGRGLDLGQQTLPELLEIRPLRLGPIALVPAPLDLAQPVRVVHLQHTGLREGVGRAQ